MSFAHSSPNLEITGNARNFKDAFLTLEIVK